MPKALFLTFILAVSCQAVSANTSAINDRLIDKFQRLKSQLAPSDNTRVNISLRLADLLSERARQKSMDGIDAKEDRQQALKNYNEVLGQLTDNQKSRVLAQMGHLYQMNKEPQKARQLYTQVLNSQVQGDLKEEAYLALAEMDFKANKYSEAAKYFSKILELPDSKKKSHAAYKLAWCSFYLNKVSEASNQLVHILQTKELLQRFDAGTGIMTVDEQFKKEVSKDLAGFLAYENSNLEKAKLLASLSPADTLSSNLSYFASELERLGHTKNAIDAWDFFAQQEASPEKRYNAYVHLSDLYRKLSNNKMALQNYEQALNTFANNQVCENDDHCQFLKEELRKIVIEWNRAEKANPSAELLSAYAAYTQQFSKDIDMFVWGAQANKVANQIPAAYTYYKNAAELMSGGVKSTDPNVSKLSDETLLLTMIELAELSKSKELIAEAQNYYIQNSKKQSKLLDVKYQQAYAVYEKGSYADAAEALNAIALSQTHKNTDIQLKAAELALDALVLAKDDQKLIAWSDAYAGLFTSQSGNFKSIQQKALLNKSAKTDLGDIESYKVLANVDSKSLEAKDKETYFRNKLILAERLQKWLDAKDAAEALYSLPTVSVENKRFAVERRVWLAELQLDFITAFEWIQKLPKEKTDTLKVALFADLAQRDSAPFYEAYLKSHKDDEQAQAIVLNIIEKSKTPSKDILKYKNILIKNKNHYASLHLEAFEKNKSPLSATALKAKDIASTPSAIAFWRSEFIKNYNKLRSELESHELSTKSQAQIRKGIAGRGKMLTSMESMLKDAISKSDWVAEALALNTMAKEYKRFYENIFSLPMPEGLTAEEQNQYMQLLSQSATPYQIKANEYEAKATEYWQNLSKVIDQLKTKIAERQPSLRHYEEEQVQALASIAADEQKPTILAVLDIQSPEQKSLDLQLVQQLKSDIRKDPLNTEKLKALLKVEKESGSVAMASYLEARVQAQNTNKEQL